MKPPTMPPIRPIITAIPIVTDHDGCQSLGKVKAHNPMRPSTTIKKKAPYAAPSMKPALIPATILPAIPPIISVVAMTAETTQCVQTPMEQSTATKRVSSKSDRRLN